MVGVVVVVVPLNPVLWTPLLFAIGVFLDSLGGKGGGRGGEDEPGEKQLNGHY